MPKKFQPSMTLRPSKRSRSRLSLTTDSAEEIRKRTTRRVNTANENLKGPTVSGIEKLSPNDRRFAAEFAKQISDRQFEKQSKLARKARAKTKTTRTGVGLKLFSGGMGGGGLQPDPFKLNKFRKKGTGPKTPLE